ncbi:MAG: amino acid/polyamine/organocation transporter, superfamily, partial [Marmoricola sp.]|nr:amino acid/polyamine/organocation transporter, superfamily [Marmoricola sp.]
FSRSQDALFTLFGAATLLPAVIYAATVVLYLVKRKDLPVNGKFDLGGWEVPVLGIAVIWLVFELSLFRDASFKDAWLYVLVMVVLGALYLGFLLARRGVHGLAMPDMHSIDAVLDRKVGTNQP